MCSPIISGCCFTYVVLPSGCNRDLSDIYTNGGFSVHVYDSLYGVVYVSVLVLIQGSVSSY